MAKKSASNKLSVSKSNLKNKPLVVLLVGVVFGVLGTWAIVASFASPAPKFSSTCSVTPSTVTVGGSYTINGYNLPTSSTLAAFENSSSGFTWYYGINNTGYNHSPYPVEGHPVDKAGHYTVVFSDRVHNQVKTVAACAFDAQ